MPKTALGIVAIFLTGTVCAAQSVTVKHMAPQSKAPVAAQGLSADPGLLSEFGQLLVKLQKNIQYPAPRGESRLLPLLPESTIFVAAVPNYGDAAHQALDIFRQELQQSSALRNWWQGGENAAKRAKFEDSVEEFSQFHQYLGEEIVLTGSMERREPSFLAFAEIHKPGLKKFLEQMVEQFGGESAAGAWCTKSGYNFRITAVCKQSLCSDYVVVATPVQASSTGVRSFCTTSDGVIRFRLDPPLVSSVTVSECRTWKPLGTGLPPQP